MKQVLRSLTVVLLLTGSSYAQPAIDGFSVQCWPSDAYRFVEATFTPPGDTLTAKLYFRAEDQVDFHFVEMTIDRNGLGRAIVPIAEGQTSNVVLFAELVTHSFTATRTEPQTVPVMSRASCAGQDPDADWYTGTNPDIALGATRPGSSMAAGFRPDGISRFVGVTGAVESGGGSSKLPFILGGIGAGVGGGVFAMSSGSGSDGSVGGPDLPPVGGGSTTTFVTTSVGGGPTSTTTTASPGGGSTTSAPGSTTTIFGPTTTSVLGGPTTTTTAGPTTSVPTTTSAPTSTTTSVSTSTSPTTSVSTTTSTTTSAPASTTTSTASTTTSTASTTTTSAPASTTTTSTASTTTSTAPPTTTTTRPSSDADLRLDSITDSKDPLVSGDFGEWVIRVTNLGPSDATNVTISIFLSSSDRVLGGECTGGGGFGQCTVGSLGSGKSASKRALIQLNGAGVHTVRANVGGTEVDPNTANNVATELTTVVSTLRTTERAPVKPVQGESLAEVLSTLDVRPLDGSIRARITLNDAASEETSNTGPRIHRLQAQPGENRVDARVDLGTSQNGTWRFDFGATRSFVSSSLRVQSGRVVSQDGTSMTFALGGGASELRFTFDLSETAP